MIAFIQGTVAAYGADYVVIDHQGIGWQAAYPHTDEIRLNQEIRIYTYMHMTENDISLFGFSSQEEKELFLRLISVKGLGPKTAMNMLASAGYENIIGAIEAGNVAALKKMPGIGAKSASQIVLDLKGRLVSVPVQTKAPAQEYPEEIRDALDALKSLGYKPSEISSAASVMMEEKGLSTQQYLRIGLKHLGRA